MGYHTLLNNRHMYTNNCSNIEEDLNEDKRELDEDKDELKQEIYATSGLFSTFYDNMKELAKQK